MALRATRSRTSSRKGHKYGDTAIQDSASAVLGDVNISGDVHVHVHSQLDEIAAAGTVVGLLHVANVLLSTEEYLIDSLATSRVAQNLIDALLQLDQTHSQLSIHCAALLTPRDIQAGQYVSSHCSYVLSEAENVAADVDRSLVRFYQMPGKMPRT